MIKEILAKSFISIASILITLIVIGTILYLAFKFALIPYLLEKIPNFIKEILK